MTIDSAPAIKADLQPGSVTPFVAAYEVLSLKRWWNSMRSSTARTIMADAKHRSGACEDESEAGTVSKATATDVHKLVDKARTNSSQTTLRYKGSGTTHDTFAGEIRAYADGKPGYQQLADTVGMRGENLQMRKQIPPTEHREGGRAVPPP